MPNSKIIFGGRTLIDLTNDDVKPENLLKGIKAHNSNGDEIEGTCEYDVKSEGTTAIAAEILKGKTAAVGGRVITGTMPNIGAVTGTISTKDSEYAIAKGWHDGTGRVSISETEKQKLIADNIREGVDILGVVGTMTGADEITSQKRVVDAPLHEDLTVLPEEGINYLSEVVVKAVSYTEIDNTADGKGITIVIG